MTRPSRALTDQALADQPLAAGDATLVDIAANPAPAHARAGYFTTSDGVRLRYGVFGRQGRVNKGTVCLVQGRTEFIEKYFETIGDFQERGFTVATFDLRGQGGSERLLRRARTGHVERFEDYWTDLKSFHTQILLPDCPPPYFLVGHSTGGLVALDAATRDRLMFDRVFAVSPLLALPLPLPPGLVAALFGVARFLGLGGLALDFGAGREIGPDDFAGNPLTSDFTRFSRTAATLAARPELAIGPPSIAWMAAALDAMREAASDRFPQKLQVPVYMVAAARDEVVLSPAIEQLGIRLRNGHYAMIPGARHEMFMEDDAVRAQVFAAFDAFVTNASV